MSMSSPLEMFDQVRIINLVDRTDRRREMEQQLSELGAYGANVRFYDAHRPSAPGEFPSLGARGCFESHLAVLREARSSGAGNLLLLEDDFDFSRDGSHRLGPLLTKLSSLEWSFFYGAHLLSPQGRTNLAAIPAQEPVMTASFLGFSGRVFEPLIDFLEGILTRPAGSPDYGPMHVDGAYTVFRELNPQYLTFAAFPPLGRQRSSRSDITPKDTILDRWKAMRGAVSLARRGYNWWRRR